MSEKIELHVVERSTIPPDVRLAKDPIIRDILEELLQLASGQAVQASTMSTKEAKRLASALLYHQNKRHRIGKAPSYPGLRITRRGTVVYCWLENVSVL